MNSSFPRAALLLAAGLTLGLGATPSRAQSPVGILYQKAMKARSEGRLSDFLSSMRELRTLRPQHPDVLYKLAAAFALNDGADSACFHLARVASTGLLYSPDSDSDFVALKGRPCFEKSVRDFQASRAPVVGSRLAFQFPTGDALPEGITYDPTEKVFYIGVSRPGRIIKVRWRSGQTLPARMEELESSRQDRGWGILGMKVDARLRRLWAVTATMPMVPGWTKEIENQSAVICIDLDSGKLLRRYVPPNDSLPHAFGDLELLPTGEALISDSFANVIYETWGSNNVMSTWLGKGSFASLQGLAYSQEESRLYFADWAWGLGYVDMKTKAVTWLPHADRDVTLGMDGLYLDAGALIGIQNAAEPHRVQRVRLNAARDRVESVDVLEVNHPLYEEPTLGVIVGNSFFYAADTHWNHFQHEPYPGPGMLKPIQYLELPLR